MYAASKINYATFWNFDFYGEMKKYTLANGKEINRRKAETERCLLLLTWYR